MEVNLIYNNMKNLIRIVWLILNFIAVWLHELSHVFAYTLVFSKIETVKVYIKNGVVGGFVTSKKMIRNRILDTFISLAPGIFFVIYIILSFYFSFFIFIVLLQIVTFKHTLPSKGDILNIKRFSIYKEMNFDQKLLKEFFEKDAVELVDLELGV